MRRTYRTLAACAIAVVALLVGSARPALAQPAVAGDMEEPSDWREILPGLTIGGQVRLRTEDRRNFRFDESISGNDEGFLLSRLRIGLTWKVSDVLTGVVELQDARIFGEEAIDEDRTPNVFADRLDVHQAYVDVATPSTAAMSLTVRAGRQKLAYGAQRLVSPLEWVNTARVFDGARVRAGLGDGRTLNAFTSRLVPIRPNGFNDHGRTPSRLFNSQFHGVYYTDAGLIAAATLEGYWLLRYESSVDDEVHTVGGRFDAAWGRWSVDVEAARQLGTYGGETQRAGMLHAGASVATDLPGRPRLGAAFNYGQGDDDPVDGVRRTFDNLYPLNHAFYGAMDFFALQNLRNVEFTVDTSLPGGAGLKVGYHRFALVEPATDAWYNAGAGVVHRATNPDVSSSVGGELDLIVKVPVWLVAIETGYGWFFGGAYLDDEHFARRTADFFYLQTLIGF